jgi:hypothetical protein
MADSSSSWWLLFDMGLSHNLAGFGMAAAGNTGRNPVNGAAFFVAA